MKKIIIAVVAVIIIVPLVIFFFFPGVLVNLSTNKARKAAGLVPKTVQAGAYTVAFLDGGSGAPVVLLHGLGGNKDNWPAFAKSLTKDYRVIALDLPGAGGSTKVATDVYSIKAQAGRLDEILGAMNLGKVHLLGHGIGGTIAGRYAAQYPGKVLSLALMDSEGIPSPVPSEFDRAVDKGQNPLAVKTVADLDNMLKFLFVTPPSAPGPVKRFLVGQMIAGGDFNQKIFYDVFGEEYSFKKDLPRIKARTLVIWGDTDRKMDVSLVKTLTAGIKGAGSAVIAKSGHFPMREKPDESAAAYLSFLKKG